MRFPAVSRSVSLKHPIRWSRPGDIHATGEAEPRGLLWNTLPSQTWHSFRDSTWTYLESTWIHFDLLCFLPCVPVSRMRSKGSRFTLGVWGRRVCSLDVAFTTATVRNRSQPSASVRVRAVWPCLWQVLQQVTCLQKVSKIVLCGGHNTFALFSEA